MDTLICSFLSPTVIESIHQMCFVLNITFNIRCTARHHMQSQFSSVDHAVQMKTSLYTTQLIVVENSRLRNTTACLNKQTCAVANTLHKLQLTKHTYGIISKCKLFQLRRISENISLCKLH